jgi:hypothetical protein
VSLGIKLTGDWGRALKALNLDLRGAVDKAMMKEAHFLRSKIILNIQSGGNEAGAPFTPLSPTTLAVRAFKGFGGSKPLIVTGALIGAVSVVRVSGGVFVGIKRSAKAGGAKLAELHEFGGGPWTRPMTDKQRRFLHAVFRNAGAASPGKSAGGGTITWRIPARPFVNPVIRKFMTPSDVRKRFWTNVAQNLGFELGRP